MNRHINTYSFNFCTFLSPLPAVHFERGILGKLGAALGALVRLVARVRSLVHQQRRLGAESFAAPGADVALVAAFVDLRGGETEATCNGSKNSKPTLWSFASSPPAGPSPVSDGGRRPSSS